MSAIRSLKRNVTKEEALRQMGGSLWRNLRFGRLQAIADVYVPFRVYQVSIENRGRRETRHVALEAVNGMLDLYALDGLPEEIELVDIETRNCPRGGLDDDHGCEIVIESVRRTLFTNGFFRLRDLRISAQPLELEIHVPYWVGFFGSRERLNVVVLDAVRRRIEGGKATKLIEGWLREQAA